MDRCRSLLARALREPASLRFVEVCRLAECHGFERVRTRGSHHIYKRPGFTRHLNLQDVTGRAKPYQVRQLLSALDELDLLPDDGHE